MVREWYLETLEVLLGFWKQKQGKHFKNYLDGFCNFVVFLVVFSNV